MQGKKISQEKLFVFYRLSDHIAQDNLYRRLDDLIDFSFLYKETARYYGKVGPQGIDPVVFMKLLLFGYLENLNSDRSIIRTASNRMDIRHFIGYDIDEALPWHSTLSRTRQLYSQDTFTTLFKKVLKQCVNMGMISGRRQAVDGFFIKANASLDSLIEREVMDDAEEFSKELEANEEKEQAPVLKVEERDWQQTRPVKPKRIFSEVIPGEGADLTAEPGDEVLALVGPSPLNIVAVNKQTDLKPKKNPSNDTHYSPSDPDAKMSVKPGKATALNYLGEISVDTATYMITHAQVFTAEKHDSQCLAAMITHTKNNLLENDIGLQEVVADAGFSSADALKTLQASRITGYIPNRGPFNPERKGFIYHTEGNSYECQNGKHLIYKGTSLTAGYWMKEYRISRKDCTKCPFQQQCSAFGKKHTKINETIDKPYYDQMHIRMQTRKAKILKKLRQSTVEPCIGTLVNFTGIKRVNTKGLEQANKCLTMAAIAYNLKKMLKYKGRPISNNGKSVKNGLKSLLKSKLCPTSFLSFTICGYPRTAFFKLSLY